MCNKYKLLLTVMAILVFVIIKKKKTRFLKCIIFKFTIIFNEFIK